MHEYTENKTISYVTINDTTHILGAEPDNVKDKPYQLFTLSGVRDYLCKAKLWWFRFKDSDGNLVSHKVAAKDSSGEIGLYDLYTGSFLTYNNTGLAVSTQPFTAGPVVETQYTESVVYSNDADRVLPIPTPPSGYSNAEGTGNRITRINKGNTQDVTVYAKWS